MPPYKDVYWENDLYFKKVNNQFQCMLCEHISQTVRPTTDTFKKHFNSKHNKMSENERKLKMSSFNNKYGFVMNNSQTSQSSHMSIDVSEQTSDSKQYKPSNKSLLKVCYTISQLIADSPHSLSVSKLVKECINVVTELLPPEMSHLSEIITKLPISSYTVIRNVKSIGNEMTQQIIDKQLDRYSLAVDDSTDCTDIPELMISMRGIDNRFNITEEMFDLVPLENRTTGEDIFQAIKASVERNGFDFNKLKSITSDGCPSMSGKNIGAMRKLSDYIKSNSGITIKTFQCAIHQESLCANSSHFNNVMKVVTNTVGNIRNNPLIHRQFRAYLVNNNSEYKDVLYYSQIRWLSRAQCLLRFFNLFDFINSFFTNIMNDSIVDTFGEPINCNKQFYFDLAFYADLFAILNHSKLELMGKNKLIVHQFESIIKVQTILHNLSEDLKSNQLINSTTDFPFNSFHCVNKVIAKHQKYDFCTEKLYDLVEDIISEFENRFSDFNSNKEYFDIFTNPFSASQIPPDFVNEINTIRSNHNLKLEFENSYILDFYNNLNSADFPLIIDNALTIATYFGTTYNCEQFFSIMKTRKNNKSNLLSAETLKACLRISTANQLKPNIDKVIEGKQYQFSH